MSIWWSLQLRREAASVPLARRLLVGAMESAGVDADIAHDLSLALTEACSNAVRHGSGPLGVYRVTALIDDDVCRIEVADSGPGFPEPGAVLPRPQEDSACELETGGRGLRLIEALSDTVRFVTEPGGRGAVVTFDRALKCRDGALLRAS
ncbi:ATP-binding protein [Streptomyces sp. 7-21]|jgi:serine/threonine-protein kinase RsbW|uniref:ATP-binding protein n=1 Tax=Streptomyces sp. 7-21 TaxID=2802283 RepID=UPI00191FF6A9|nr:ATP-binding protein [Streptomyces sp. 7-21]MBL1067959.1 ATP-binding protein [Streptomyces sp. 7-21]